MAAQMSWRVTEILWEEVEKYTTICLGLNDVKVVFRHRVGEALHVCHLLSVTSWTHVSMSVTEYNSICGVQLGRS